jgi:hypothetical protein
MSRVPKLDFRGVESLHNATLHSLERFHRERKQQGLSNQRLGELLNYYHRRAV